MSAKHCCVCYGLRDHEDCPFKGVRLRFEEGELVEPPMRNVCAQCTLHLKIEGQPEDKAYHATKEGKWRRLHHACGIWIEKKPVGVGVAKKLLAELKPDKRLPKCGELIILSERDDKWHVELVNRCQYLHLQRWEY